MTPLETYLGTHLRYTAWATKRTLKAVAKLTPEEYLRELGSGHGSVRGTLEHMFYADLGWYELLAGERADIEPPPNDDWYSIAPNLELDYRELLRQYEVLASFLDDLDLALAFSHAEIYVPWLDNSIPKWQGALNIVSHATYHRGQIATLLRQLGQVPLETDLIFFLLELEGKPV